MCISRASTGSFAPEPVPGKRLPQDRELSTALYPQEDAIHLWITWLRCSQSNGIWGYRGRLRAVGIRHLRYPQCGHAFLVDKHGNRTPLPL